MSNMAYCRFTNTLRDLRDCKKNFENISSKPELDAARKLVMLCREIAEFGPEVEELELSEDSDLPEDD